MWLSSPTLVLRLALLLCVLVILGAFTLVLREPVLGLHLSVDYANAELRLRDAGIAELALPQDGAPYQLASLGEPGAPAFALEHLDLVEEPDLLANNGGIERLYGRQSVIHALLQAPVLQLTFTGSDGSSHVRELEPRARALGELPYTFWLQLVVAVASFLIGAWIYSLRQADWAARSFLLSGLGILVSASCAAIYSSRELALDGTLFKALSAGNFFGAALFGAAMVGLFLLYPKPLLRLRGVLAAMSVFLLATLYHIGERYALVPHLDPSFYMPPMLILAEMSAIVLCAVLQYFATRGDPAARAVLRWLGLSIVICSGFFIIVFYMPVIMGVPLPVSQGHSFVVFLLIYIGIGMGLRRYRLFDLGTWSFQIMFYLSALVGFFLLDALIISQLDFSAAWSTGVSLLVIGFVYLPLRDWLWSLTLGRKKQQEHDWFAAVMAIPFSANSRQATQRWHQLLGAVFEPLQLEEMTATGVEPQLVGEGVGICIPASGSIKAVLLQYSHGGKRLFSSADLVFVQQLLQMLAQAEQSRASYEEGRLQERRRIAQDLHDDIGSQLLSSLHSNDLDNTQANIRKTISDLRAVVAGLVGTQTPLAELISVLRFECGSRLEEAGVEIDWPVNELDDLPLLVDYRFAKNITSIIRECITNVIKHSQATQVRIQTKLQGEGFYLSVSDNGIGLQAGRRHGNGLGNIRQRVTALSGRALIATREGGALIQVECPLSAGAPLSRKIPQ